jgi:hypothetical protein
MLLGLDCYISSRKNQLVVHVLSHRKARTNTYESSYPFNPAIMSTAHQALSRLQANNRDHYTFWGQELTRGYHAILAHLISTGS